MERGERRNQAELDVAVHSYSRERGWGLKLVVQFVKRRIYEFEVEKTMERVREELHPEKEDGPRH